MFPNVEKNAFHLRHNLSAKVKTFSRIHLKQKRVENNMTEKAQKAPLSVFQLFLTTLYLLFFPALLFFVAGDWYWIEGWVYSVIFVGLCFALIIYLYFNDPGLLKERYSPAYQKGQALWDKVFLSVFMLLYFVWFVIIPLDAKRYHWSPEFPLWVKIVGGLLTILSFVIIFEVFRENSFAAPVVKVQEERPPEGNLDRSLRHNSPSDVYGCDLYFHRPISFAGVSLCSCDRPGRDRPYCGQKHRRRKSVG
jgi:protein-S-isoprenylcysteine O-methyltransferase Ste14